MAFKFEEFLLQIGQITPKTFASEEYRSAITIDIAALPRQPGKEDQFFNSHVVPQCFMSVGLDLAAVRAWEAILESIRIVDPGRFSQMHKGTPYYFLGIASYRMDDFERAVFYMDSAVAEDFAANGANWVNVPAGYFFRLDGDSLNQYGRELVLRTRSVLNSLLQDTSAMWQHSLDVESFISKLIQPAISEAIELRSAVTTLFTYVLEFEKLLRHLRLSSNQPSTSEPFYIHLFKGTLLLETLLKNSNSGKLLGGGNTLNKYLGNTAIKTALGLPSDFQGMGRDLTFEKLVNSIPARADIRLPDDSFRISWGVRNTVGHSLSWTSKLTADQYELLFMLIFAAITITVVELY
jgi:hypothetical protein